MNVRARRAARICSLVAVAAIIPLTAVPAAGQQADVIRVDLGRSTGDFLGGASGTLYGLYDEGLPSENLVDGIDLATVSTKAQDGPQHPGADALEVLPGLVEASDGDVYIYMTDIHRGFPYQWPGDTPEEKLGTYLEKIRIQAEQVATLPADQRDNIVFMPFNEPEGNMFGTGTWSYNRVSWLNDPQYFFSAWNRAYRVIRSVLPDARIGGPNTTVLYNQVYGFMEHAIASGTVPDVMAWHELSNPATIRSNVAKYRGWEADFFAGTPYQGTELPINISEYAYRYHTSVPGQMIQWVSALEDSKVYGDMAYWNIDGNLSDSAVQANRANGQWWLLHAYSQMSGQTVQVTPPRPGVSYTLQGVATLDTAKRQARVLLGGASGAHTLALDNVPSGVFGQQVHAVVREIGWSGQIGDSAQPSTVAELDVAVSGGTAQLTFGSGELPALDAESAYEVIVTPSVSPGDSAVPQKAWEATYEAETATWAGEGLHRNGPEGSPSNVSKFYTSGGYNVGGMRTGSNNAISFNVTVPRDGVYDLSVFASSLNTDAEVQQQGPTNMFLRVDGDAATEQELFLSLGYKWVVWDHTDTTVALTAGNHVITLATRSLNGSGAITGDVIIDKIDLSLPHPDYASDVYEAEFAEFSGGASPTYPNGHNGSGPGAAAVPAGGEATFWVYSPDDAHARLDVASLGDGSVDLEVNGESMTTEPGGIVNVFLLGGINQVAVKGALGLEVDRLAVTPSDGTATPAHYEAEDGVVAGSAEVTSLSLASGGAAVTGIGGDPGNGNTLTFDNVEVPESGRYALTFRYSNEEQSPATHYNPDPVARYALVSINGADPVRVIFPHSFHENNFWELTVPVDLRAGVNSIVVRGEEKPQFDGTSYASDAWPGVLLRSRFAPNLDRIAVSDWTTGEVGGDDAVRYEAEDSPAVCDGSIASNHAGYSGTGFCDTPNTTGTAAQFTVTSDSAREATVKIRFANGSSGGARGANVVVNGSTVTSTSFENTGGWSTWGTQTLTVPLNAGDNTIRLVATGADGLPNVDYLDLVVPDPGGNGDPVRYEAEDAPATCEGTIDANHSGYSGTGFCNTPNTTGTACQFTVTADGAGQVTVAIRFANGASAARGANVVVNGAAVASASFENTGPWSTWSTKTVTVPLNAGDNTIRLVATGSGGLPNIDYLEA